MYETIYQYYNESFASMPLWSLKGATIGFDYPKDDNNDGVYNSVEFDILNETKITLTGRYLKSASGDTCFQAVMDGSYVYIWQSDFKLWSQASTSTMVKAYDYLNSLIKNNKTILERNLFCSRIIQVATEKGITIPVEPRQKLYSLQNKLLARDKQIRDSGYNTQIEVAYSPNLSLYNQALVDFMNKPGIGFVLTTTAVIIIASLVVASTATVAILLYKKLHDESKVDFDYSAELTSDLIKYLPEDIYKQLLEENKENESIANDAISAASGNSLFTTIKYVAVGLLGFWAVDKFLSTRKN